MIIQFLFRLPTYIYETEDIGFQNPFSKIDA